MTSLKSNLVKRIERLPQPSNTSDALIPLFEAISNAIHSTQARFRDRVAEKGKIVVTVSTGRKRAHVTATVEDNGEGLTERNYEAFTTTDTDNKIAMGGKGVGRLLWLHSFQNIRIASVFEERGLLKRRSFDFELAMDDQIKNHRIENVADDVKEPGFHVHFDGLRDNGYKAKFPGRQSFVFQHLISHFLPVFIGGRCPLITLHCNDETQHYPDAIKAIVHRREDVSAINTSEHGVLALTLMECDKVASADLKGTHFVHFVAHDRTVHSQRIDGKLGLKAFGTSGDRVFHAVLTGEFLDANVNQERTAFVFGDDVIEKIVNEACMPYVQRFLATPLAELSSDQKRRVAGITESYPSVAFGNVEELQEHIPTGELSEDAIFGHLSRERYRRDQKQAEKIRSVLQRLREGHANVESFSEAISSAGRAIEDAEQKSLAEYVVRRKVVLDFIELLLDKVRDDTRDSSYQREDLLHAFICPLRVNSLENGERRVEAAASHDLWIVDERLTFAKYFSSDEEFHRLSGSIDSDDRSDILIFDHVHGLRESKDSSKVLVVEFKRPGRTTYPETENPVRQVEGYVRKLLEGGRIDVRGRPIDLSADTVFYCYIVADIVGPLADWTYSWQRTADGRGRIYQPGHGFKGSIELIPWDNLLRDAKARNQAFFDNAGISGRSFFSDDVLASTKILQEAG